MRHPLLTVSAAAASFFALSVSARAFAQAPVRSDDASVPPSLEASAPSNETAPASPSPEAPPQSPDAPSGAAEESAPDSVETADPESPVLAPRTVLVSEPPAAVAIAEPSFVAPPPEPKKEHFFDKVNVRGYTQFRYNQLAVDNDKLVNVQGDKSMTKDGGIFIRRARIVLSGDIHPRVSIYLQPDFASAAGDSLNYAQMRDWYFDLFADEEKTLRLRIGQSKIPFGFENLQSSGNRLPFDRSDAINSAAANERDLGAFIYYAPQEIRRRFKALVDDGLKGSGDYGMLALGAYNGQSANKFEQNDNLHVVARVAYPFLFGEQYFEVWGGGYYGRFTIDNDDAFTIDESETLGGPDAFRDTRANAGFSLYPQPFGLQAEYNLGVGPELTDVQEGVDADGSAVFSGIVREEFLHGGYVLASLRLVTDSFGTFTPYVRGMLYEGGKKHETNAPKYSIKELESGVEWQIIKPLELTAAYTRAERTFSKPPYEQEKGGLVRLQVQVNY